VSRPFIRPAVAALAAVGLALWLGPLGGLVARAAAEPGVHVRLTFAPGCEGLGTLEVLDLTKEVLVARVRVSWKGPGSLWDMDEGWDVAYVGGSPMEPQDEIVLRLRGQDGRVLASLPARPIPGDAYGDFEVAAHLECTTVPYRVLPPATSTAEPGTDGEPFGSPAVLVLLFGFALVASSAYAAHRVRPPRPRGG
jgi:hypothetical protein